MDLLKKFHIFWNVHRQRGQMEGLHHNTFQILKSLYSKYNQTNDAMKAVTLHLLKNINDAYKKFLKADKMQTVIKKNSSEMIVIQLLRRVKHNTELLFSNNLSYDKQIIEYANLIDLLQSFFLINNSDNIEDEKNQELY